MAKIQGISMNPNNIIGACGRLKCCLNYEYEGYKILMDSMPRVGSKCSCDGCDGVILERNLLTKRLVVQLDDKRVVEVSPEEVVPLKR